MTETTTRFSSIFRDRDNAVAMKYEQLFLKLVPPIGEATTAAGEVLRAVTRIFHDLYNNGLGNGPFTEEVATLRRFKAELVTRMEQPEYFENLMQEAAPYGAVWGDMHIRDINAWPYGPALDDLMTAVAQYVDECVREREAAGVPAGAPVTMLYAGDELASVEAALAEKHLGGRHAQSLPGELFRAMRILAQVIEVKGSLKPEHRYELTLLTKFAPELDIDASSINTLCWSLNYHLEETYPVPAMSSWPHATAFYLVCEAVVRFVGITEGLIPAPAKA